jgi:hypothetical protein
MSKYLHLILHWLLGRSVEVLQCLLNPGSYFHFARKSCSHIILTPRGDVEKQIKATVALCQAAGLSSGALYS